MISQKSNNYDHSSKFLLCTLILVITQFSVSYSPAAIAQTNAASVVSFEGQVWIISGDNKKTVVSGEQLSAGSVIKTGKDGRAVLLLADETAIRLNNNSEFSLNSSSETAGWLTNFNNSVKSRYRLLKGELWFRNKQRAADIQIDTNHVSISVRGTEFTVISDAVITTVNMLEGKVRASNDLGQLDAVSGEQVIAEAGKAPIKRILLRPDDAVQWTLRVPKGYDFSNIFAGVESNGKNDSSHQTVSAAWALYNADQFSDAFESLNADDSLASYIPALRLKALTALLINQNNTGLQSMIAVTQSKAANASDWLMRSYLEQSIFDLASARKSAKTATKLERQNAEAWLQRSALAVANGNFQQAKLFIDTATQLSNSKDADILAARGFVYSALSKNEIASRAFENALQLQPNTAMAHLGKALESTRNKRYESALESISKAVAVEPANAGLLNYYAKILYTIGRKDRALEVLQRAQELDPYDPSPLYIEAIIERDRHRDARAIALLHKAEELNDNRGVYRSKQLLDSDRATNSADLTLAFDPFDFFAWAESRSRNAVAQSPNNYNAHLMYASSLSKQSGKELAFAAENFKSRLLTPYDGNPLDIANDYTDFFEQNVAKGVAEVRAGSFRENGVGLTLFGHDKKSRTFSSILLNRNLDEGYTRSMDRANNQVAGLFKWDPSYQTGFTLQGLYAEYSQKESLEKLNNASLTEEPRNRVTTNFEETSFGVRHNFNPELTLLANAGWYRNKFKIIEYQRIEQFSGTPFARMFDFIDNAKGENESWQLQSRLQLQKENIMFATGAHASFGDRDLSTRHSADLISGTPLSSNPNIEDIDSKRNPRSYSAYAELYLKTNQHWESHYLLSLDQARVTDGNFTNQFDQQYWDIDVLKLVEPNKRIGFVHTPLLNHPTFKIRAAYVESLYSNRQDRLDNIEHAGILFLKPGPDGNQLKQAIFQAESELGNSGFFTASGYYDTGKWETREFFDIQVTTPGGIQNNVTGKPALNYVRNSGGRFDLNLLLNRRVGLSLSASYKRSDTRQEQLGFVPTFVNDDNINDREEHSVSATLAMKSLNGINLKLKQEYRDINFDSESSSLEDRYIAPIDLELELELANSRGLVKVELNNILDEQFDYFLGQFESFREVTPERNVLATLRLNLR